MAKILRQHNPDKAFIVLQSNSKNVTIKHSKCMVDYEITLGQYIGTVCSRKYIEISDKQNLTVFIDNHIPLMTTLVGTLYNNYKHADAIMYLNIETENVFG